MKRRGDRRERRRSRAWALVSALVVAAVTATVGGTSPQGAALEPDGPIVVIAGNARPPVNDRAIVNRLRATGRTVSIVDDDKLNSVLPSLDDAAMVVITSSAAPAKVGRKLRELAVPVLTWEPLLHDEMGLSVGPNGENASSTLIDVVDPAHPLAAGLSGRVAVLTAANRMSFGTPPSSAQVVAVAHNRSDRAVLYTLDEGAALAGGGTAAACRTVLFPNYNGANKLSPAGVALVDAAIDYTLGCAAMAVPDLDGDGYSPPEDCDDDDASVNPGAIDIVGDEIDQNCDGVIAVDLDGDGWPTPEDCDDADPARYPGAVDIPGDGIDQDCSGRDAGGIRNVVFVMVDDMAASEMVYLQQTADLLGGEGVTFANSFTNNPLCCPTRATLLTGQRSRNHGVQNNVPRLGGGYPALDHTNTFAIWAQAAGYVTAHVGKFMNGYGTFDLYPGVDNLKEIPPGWTDWQTLTQPLKSYQFKLNDNTNVVQYKPIPEHHQTDVISRRALDVIDESIAADAPFFLWVNAHAPHTVQGEPPYPTARHENTFAGLPLVPTPNFDEADVSDKPSFVQEKATSTAALREEWRYHLQRRAESLLAVDEMVAAIYARLDQLGALDDTLLIFTSDNGYLFGQHRLTGKQVVYEESIRVPLLMRGGPFRGGVVVDELVSNFDVVPTMVELLGVTPQRTMDGLDLAPIVGDPTTFADRALIIESFDAPIPYMAVRTEHWVWVEYDNGERELYDLVADPYQLDSKHADPAYAVERSVLEAALGQLRDCAGAACDVRLALPPRVD